MTTNAFARFLWSNMRLKGVDSAEELVERMRRCGVDDVRVEDVEAVLAGDVEAISPRLAYGAALALGLWRPACKKMLLDQVGATWEAAYKPGLSCH